MYPNFSYDDELYPKSSRLSSLDSLFLLFCFYRFLSFASSPFIFVANLLCVYHFPLHPIPQVNQRQPL